MTRLQFCLARTVKLVLVLMFVLCVGCVLPMWAQSVDSGTVVGTVTDPTGAVVNGASVKLTDPSTGLERTTTTGNDGHYTFVSVPSGTYDISVSKSGFSTTKADKQQVTVGKTFTVNISLQIGGGNTVVEVTATGTELQTTDATVGTTITGDALDSLPGLGRDVSTFVTLQPGVAPDGSVGGANQDQNSFQLDGGNNSSDMDGTQNTYTASFAGDPTGGLVNNEVTGTAPGGSPGGGGPTGVMPTPADSIEEFRVATSNQTADFNSSSGAQVRLVTKRGTNAWHGSLYEYYLDNNWAGNSYDNNHQGTPRPSYHYNRFGGSIGGALPGGEVLGGKTFIFANYEGFRWPNSATTTRATPSDDMRLGLLTDTQTGGLTYNLNPYPVTSSDGTLYAANANCGAFPGGLCDPQGIGVSNTMQQMWTAMPEGNPGAGNCSGLSRCDGVNVLSFQSNYPVIWNDNFGVVRLDHDFGAKERFYTTYRYYHQQRQTGNQIDITGGTPTSTATRPSVPWFYTASLSTTITSNLTNDFHYSFLRNWWARTSLADPPQVPGLGGALEPEGETSTNVLAPLNLDTQDVRTRFWDGDDHMIRDDVSWIKGTHFFTVGGIYQHNWNYHQRTDNGGGINYQTVYWLGAGVGCATCGFNGMDMTNYLPAGVGSKWIRDYGIILGVPGLTQIAYTRTGQDLQLNPPNTPAFDKSTIPFYNLYFNDSWRMKPSLTLSYGLGWALEMPPKEEQGKQIAFVDNNDKIIDTAAYLGSRRSAALAGQVFNPNVGFALIGNVAGHPSNFYNPFYKGFSPRVAVAWNPRFDDGMMATIFGRNQTVIRGGYSILYGRLNGVGLVLLPLLGDGLIQSARCISPVNDGSCAGQSGSTPANSFRICDPAGPNGQPNCGGLVAPLPTASQTLPQPAYTGINALAAQAVAATDPNLRPSLNHQYDVTIQRQLNNRNSIEVGYIGRHITHEFQPVSVNGVPYMMTVGGQRFDQAYGQMVVQYCGGNDGMKNGGCAGSVGAVIAQPFFETALAGTGYCTGFANCTQAVASYEGGNIAGGNVWSMWSNLDGGGVTCDAGNQHTYTNGTTGPCGFNFARSMLNSPLNCVVGDEIGCGGEVNGIAENTSLGYANYNALFFTYKMSPWHGLAMQSNFTWSKALGTGSQVQATSQYSTNDPFNQSRGYGYQPWDRKFMFNIWATYSPAVYQNQSGVAGHLLGGWTFAPILDIGSGLPTGIYTGQWPSSAYTGGQSFGGMDGANTSDYENAVNICGKNPSITRHNTFSDGSNGSGDNAPANGFSDPEAVSNCFRQPILGIDNGHNGGIGNLRGLPFWNVDFNLKKTVRITEQVGAEFGATFTNIFNHNQLADPGQTYLANSPGDFGALETGGGAFQVDNPRKIEIDFRFKF